MIAAAAAGLLALQGCGRKGLPEAPSTVAAKKAANAPADKAHVDPTANVQGKLPPGVSDPALKAGAQKQPTPFDFML
jgi:hypothetical protein